MHTLLKKRLLAAALTLLSLVTLAMPGVAADGFKPVTINGGDQGALIIEVRNNKGVLYVRTGSFAVATVNVSKKRWVRLIDAWHLARTAAEEGQSAVIGVFKVSDDKRVGIEVDKKNVKLSLIDDTSSRTFTLYAEDQPVFNSAIERVLEHLED